MNIDKNKARSSAMYIGFLILDGMKKMKTDKVSIYKVAELLGKRGVKSSRQLVLGLTFLHSVDVIEFEEANVCIKK